MKNNTIGFITVIVLLSVTSAFSLNLFFRQRTAQDKLDIQVFPYVIGEWKGQDLKITEDEYKILETRNLILRKYVNPQGENLFLFIIYSETNRSVFHPPEVCLIGSGVKILNKESEKIDSGGYKFCVNKLYAEKDNSRELVFYCYKAGDLYTDNFYLQQAYFAVNQLLAKHIRGATIRASMPLKDDEKPTLAALKTFIVQAAKIIDSLNNS